MMIFTARIAPLSAFGTPLKGDTLFGQFCWTLRNRHGEKKLAHLLDGYDSGHPFAVISDALPADHLPRPALPGFVFEPLKNEDRKITKKRIWLPIGRFNEQVTEWLRHCLPGDEMPGGDVKSHPHPHNAIDRRTGATGEGFSPYAATRYWYDKGSLLDIHVVLDETKLSPAELEQALRDIGELGFGRDASIGLGRFTVYAFSQTELPSQPGANAWLTLAPCAPQGLVWDEARCFYTVFTRFGRHGDIGVHHGNPFKSPVLLANTGAALTPTQFRSTFFTGQGLGGAGLLSKAIPETVHQGYAPVLGIRLPEMKGVINLPAGEGA